MTAPDPDSLPRIPRRLDAAMEVRSARVRRMLEGVEQAECPFCERVTAGNVILRGMVAAVIPDAQPRSTGHVLVVPVAHIGDFFAVPAGTVTEMWHLLRKVQQQVSQRHRPSGWTVRVNVGEVAGQTVFHTHMHLVPRYRQTALPG